jgi:SET domain-containing protein
MGEFLVRRKSEINGLGVFTNKSIKKDEVFYEVPIEYLYDHPEPRFACIGGKVWVSDNKVLNWINHSCDANTLLDVNSKIPRLIAAREIEPGEEITCDYDTTEVGGTNVPCTCNSKKCKGEFMRIE